MDIFLKRVTPPQGEPQAGLSGNIFKKCIVIIGNDSSFILLSTETFQWDKIFELKDSDIYGPGLCNLKPMCMFVS